MIRTSCTHPLRIDAIHVSAGRLGLTFCPGKQGDSLNGAPWARDLEADIVALREWGADQVVTLMERHEFSVLRVPDLDARVVAHGMTWTHLPIPDQDVPKAAFEAAWPQVRATLLSNLHAGSSVVLHCRGGLGRTGLVAALILIETGMAAEKAIQAVRSLRPRAIETAAQERYVLNYRPGPVQKNCP